MNVKKASSNIIIILRKTVILVVAWIFLSNTLFSEFTFVEYIPILKPTLRPPAVNKQPRISREIIAAMQDDEDWYGWKKEGDRNLLELRRILVEEDFEAFLQKVKETEIDKTSPKAIKTLFSSVLERDPSLKISLSKLARKLAHRGKKEARAEEAAKLEKEEGNLRNLSPQALEKHVSDFARRHFRIVESGKDSVSEYSKEMALLLARGLASKNKPFLTPWGINMFTRRFALGLEGTYDIKESQEFITALSQLPKEKRKELRSIFYELISGLDDEHNIKESLVRDSMRKLAVFFQSNRLDSMNTHRDQIVSLLSFFSVKQSKMKCIFAGYAKPEWKTRFPKSVFMKRGSVNAELRLDYLMGLLDIYIMQADALARSKFNARRTIGRGSHVSIPHISEGSNIYIKDVRSIRHTRKKKRKDEPKEKLPTFSIDIPLQGDKEKLYVINSDETPFVQESVFCAIKLTQAGCLVPAAKCIIPNICTEFLMSQETKGSIADGYSGFTSSLATSEKVLERLSGKTAAMIMFDDRLFYGRTDRVSAAMLSAAMAEGYAKRGIFVIAQLRSEAIKHLDRYNKLTVRVDHLGELQTENVYLRKMQSKGLVDIALASEYSALINGKRFPGAYGPPVNVTAVRPKHFMSPVTFSWTEADKAYALFKDLGFYVNIPDIFTAKALRTRKKLGIPHASFYRAYFPLMLLNPTYGPPVAWKERRDENIAILNELIALSDDKFDKLIDLTQTADDAYSHFINERIPHIDYGGAYSFSDGEKLSEIDRASNEVSRERDYFYERVCMLCDVIEGMGLESCARLCARMRVLSADLEIFQKRTATLSHMVRVYNTLAHLAHIAKKKRYSIPEIDTENENRFMDIKGLYHPALESSTQVSEKKTKPVKNDVKVEAGKVLCVLGPNAGGKSVLLKAITLASINAAAGFPVMADSIKANPFSRVMLLSPETFFSDDKNRDPFELFKSRVEAAIKAAGPDMLVVIDELGAGCIEEELVPFWLAAIEQLQKKGAAVIISTHMNWALPYLKKRLVNNVSFVVSSLNEEGRSDYKFLPVENPDQSISAGLMVAKYNRWPFISGLKDKGDSNEKTPETVRTMSLQQAIDNCA